MMKISVDKVRKELITIPLASPKRLARNNKGINNSQLQIYRKAKNPDNLPVIEEPAAKMEA